MINAVIGIGFVVVIAGVGCFVGWLITRHFDG